MRTGWMERTVSVVKYQGYRRAFSYLMFTIYPIHFHQIVPCLVYASGLKS